MKWTEQNIPDQSKKVAVVTGSNSGIGFETAKALAEKGAEVVLACRSKDKGMEALARIQIQCPNAKLRFESLDLSDLDSVASFAEQIKKTYKQLDLLINNAGVMIPPESKTKQGFELQFGVNHLGHFALTAHLSSLISKTANARVVSVSSMAHRSGRMVFDDLNFERRGYAPWSAYGQSKLSNLLFILELQKQFQKHGVDAIAAASHPGYTATELQRTMTLSNVLNPLLGMKPSQGALPSLRAATDPDVQGGDYFGPDRFMGWQGYPQLASRTDAAKNEADAETLWQVSEEMTGVSFTWS